MSIKQRIQKLELTNGPETVIYITDPFTGNDEPVIRGAYVNGKEYERNPGEEQSTFRKRVNPAGQRIALLESDVDQL